MGQTGEVDDIQNNITRRSALDMNRDMIFQKKISFLMEGGVPYDSHAEPRTIALFGGLLLVLVIAPSILLVTMAS